MKFQDMSTNAQAIELLAKIRSLRKQDLGNLKHRVTTLERMTGIATTGKGGNLNRRLAAIEQRLKSPASSR